MEADFQDIDPLQEPVAAEPTRQSSTTGSVKEKVLKMSSLIDQSDDSELLPPATCEINTWLQSYHSIMGAMPEEAEGRAQISWHPWRRGSSKTMLHHTWTLGSLGPMNVN